MNPGEVDVVVLAGGLGTRLQSVLPETPKILAPVGGRPFLELLLNWLESQGVRRVVLCLGYRAADVLAWLETHSFSNLRIQHVIEPEPLGTGGALANAIPVLSGHPVLVMNGDTMVHTDLNAFLAAHCAANAPASLLCVEVPDAARYGRVDIDAGGHVVRFMEKDATASGTAWINGGFYLFGSQVMDVISKLSKGSLERDVLEKLPPRTIHAFRANGRFLDIGTPETFAVASEVLLT